MTMMITNFKRETEIRNINDFFTPVEEKKIILKKIYISTI